MEEIELKTNATQVAKELSTVKSALADVSAETGKLGKNTAATTAQTNASLLAHTAHNQALVNENLNLSLLNLSVTSNTAAMMANIQQLMLANAQILAETTALINANLAVATNTTLLTANSESLLLNATMLSAYMIIVTAATAFMQAFNDIVAKNTELLNANATAIGGVAEKYAELCKEGAIAAVVVLAHAGATYLDSKALEGNNKQLKDNVDKFKEQYKAVGISSGLLALHMIALVLDSTFLKRNSAALYANAAAQWAVNAAKAASIILSTFGAGSAIVVAAGVAAAAMLALGGIGTGATALITGATVGSTPMLPSSNDFPQLPGGGSSGNLPMLPMASGGIVSAPTYALVGEGKYPEAVVPLGSSPQFTQMKNDIANTVLSGLAAAGLTGGKNKEPIVIELVLDGDKFARAVIPAIDKENRRRGYNLQVRRV